MALRVLIAGGGTGGHVIPALAIGRELRDRHGAQVRFVGTARGIETRLVPEAGFALELVPAGQLKNVSLCTRLHTLADLPMALGRCLRLLQVFRPQVVVGVGGYASGPAMLAALLLRVPTVAYEPNAVPGLVNRLVGRFVHAAAVNFPATAGYFRNATVTGVPVRQAIFAVQPRRPGSAPRLLITAGSNGAKVFNDTMPAIAEGLLRAVPALTILHQAGPRAVEATRTAYERSGADPARWEVRAFVDDMAAEYQGCSLVLGRAGSTVAELCAAGRPSLLVPFPQAADDHQRKNAEALVEGGAALMMLQANVTAETLLRKLTEMLQDEKLLHTMGLRARGMAKMGALERITALCIEVSGGH